MLDILVVMFLYLLLSLVLNNYYYMKIKVELEDLKKEVKNDNEIN